MPKSPEAFLVLLALCACGRGDERRNLQHDSVAGRVSDAARVPAMLTSARAHVESLVTFSGAPLERALGHHQEVAGQLLDAMAADLRSAGKPDDRAWTALMDSARSDLAELPGRQGTERIALARRHAERLERLMVMYERLVADNATGDGPLRPR